MRLCIFTEPQEGATYDELRQVAQRTEECGYDAFFRSDHYLAMDTDGGPGPTDAWLTLAGLALQTDRIRLGTLVSSATFRLPGPLAISVAQVDQMSGGRVELGLGGGWYEAEHRAYGIAFPPLAERFDRLTEQLEVITGLWATPAGERFSHPGRFYPVDDSPALPKPTQRPRPPLIIGGLGARRTPALAARFADEFNVPFQPVDTVAQQYARVRQACADAGRDEPPQFSAAVVLCCGRDDAEVRRRAEAIGHDVQALRAKEQAVGTPDEVVQLLARLAEQGATRIYLQTLDLRDLDHLDLVAERVAPQLP